MSSFKKARLLTEEEYQDWRNHKCNEDQLQKIDMLNKKYADTILSEEANREQNIEAANDSGAVDGATEDMPVETPDRSFVNGTSSVSNGTAEESNSNPPNANELSNHHKGSDNKEGDSTSTLAPPPSTPITQAQPSADVYDCILTRFPSLQLQLIKFLKLNLINAQFQTVTKVMPLDGV